MCATACPVQVNTGDLVKRLRAEHAGWVTRRGWQAIAARWDTATRGISAALNVAAKLPPALPETGARTARAVLGSGRVPQWHRDLPSGGGIRRPRQVTGPEAVYIPSCLNTLFGPAEGGPGMLNALLTLAERAGAQLLIPGPIAGLCCGTPWSSKGMPDGYAAMRDQVLQVLREATRGGALPVVSDAASCSEGFARLAAAAGDEIQVTDSSAYVATSTARTHPLTAPARSP